jgi:hypothetical protein
MTHMKKVSIATVLLLVLVFSLAMIVPATAGTSHGCATPTSGDASTGSKFITIALSLVTLEECPDDPRPIAIPSMFLYTSEAGFDAGFNTCSIISNNVPGSERVAALCGNIPADLNNTCAGPVYADGDGEWACDVVQAEWGEIRLPLYGEGGLLEIYNAYKTILNQIVNT